MPRKLSEQHPFMKKVNKLYEIMEEMNIRIDYNGINGLDIVDTENGNGYRLKDNESGEAISDFPYFAEFKLVTRD